MPIPMIKLHLIPDGGPSTLVSITTFHHRERCFSCAGNFRGFRRIPITVVIATTIIVVSRFSSGHHHGRLAGRVSSVPATRRQPAVRASLASQLTGVHHRAERTTRPRTAATLRSPSKRRLETARHTLIEPWIHRNNTQHFFIAGT